MIYQIYELKMNDIQSDTISLAETQRKIACKSKTKTNFTGKESSLFH